MSKRYISDQCSGRILSTFEKWNLCVKDWSDVWSTELVHAEDLTIRDGAKKIILDKMQESPFSI
jgi:hypothetical protein